MNPLHIGRNVMNIETPTSTALLACLTSASQDPSVLRTAQRHARAREIPWIVVYLELWDDHKDARVHARNRVLEQLALAERMGAITIITKASDYARAFQEALAECARRGYAVPMLVAGAVGVNATQHARRALHAVQEQAEGRELLLVEPPEEQRRRLSWLERLHMRRLTVSAVVWALVAVVACYMVDLLVRSSMPPDIGGLDHTHSFLIYLIGCAVVAGRFGLLPALISMVASFIVINLLVIHPTHTLRVENFAEAVSLGLFLIAASIVSLVNSQVHAEAEASEINEWRMQALLQVYKIALHARSRHEALSELHSNLHQFLHAETAVFLPSVIAPSSLQQVWPEEAALTDQDMEMLQRCWEELQSGHDVDAYNPSTGWWFEPLTSANGELGMLAVRVPAVEATDTHFEHYLRTIAELVSSILEKIESTDIKEESRVRVEREKLRTNLLSSVSHDLKTPLAAIIGSLSVYRSMYDKLPEAQRKELTGAALAEAQRLDSFITNILDLAKFESGAVKFKREWQLADDVVQRVKKRLRQRIESHQLVVHAPASAVEIELDPVVSEQALMNVFDNAIKYTEAGSTIEVRMETSDGAFLLHVRDHGNGIPDDQCERIFDKYTRLQRQDHQVAGTGLGLSVARAAMRGQGGDVVARNHPDGGAEFTLSWPQWRVGSHGRKSA